MSTPEPEPPDDDSYPASWRPREAVERDDAIDAPDVEAYIGSLSPTELQGLLARARGNR